MKDTGIVRKVDDLGRIVIPMELRRSLKIEIGTPLEIYSNSETIVLKKHQSGCHCCGEMNGLVNILGLDICPKCLEEFKKATAITDKIRKCK